jgi:hypothetical protein
MIGPGALLRRPGPSNPHASGPGRAAGISSDPPSISQFVLSHPLLPPPPAQAANGDLGVEEVDY